MVITAKYNIHKLNQTSGYSVGILGNILSLITLIGRSFGRKRSGSDKIGSDIANPDDRARFFLEEYGDSMLRLAYSYLHNYADSEEIIQDAIMKMLDVNTSFESMAHEKSYIMTVVSNLSKNKIKYNKLRETDELMEELSASNKEDLSFVWEAVKSLPEKYREVVHLFYYEGYKTSEIAEILGENENTVRSNLSRGRKELKDILKEEYDFE